MTVIRSGISTRSWKGRAIRGRCSRRSTGWGARHISIGHHTLEILAYDKLKNVTRKDVTIVHLPEGSHHHG